MEARTPARAARWRGLRHRWRHVPVRWRLTAWYALLLTGAMLAFGIAMYAGLRINFDNALN